MFHYFIFLNSFLKIYLFERVVVRKEEMQRKERMNFHLQVHSPDGHNGWFDLGQSQESGLPLGFPSEWWHLKCRGHVLLNFPGHYRTTVSEVEWPGFEPSSNNNSSIAGGNLQQYNTQTHNFISKIEVISIFPSQMWDLTIK